jgi:hypothetical protein
LLYLVFDASASVVSDILLAPFTIDDADERSPFELALDDDDTVAVPVTVSDCELITLIGSEIAIWVPEIVPDDERELAALSSSPLLLDHALCDVLSTPFVLLTVWYIAALLSLYVAEPAMLYG